MRLAVMWGRVALGAGLGLCSVALVGCAGSQSKGAKSAEAEQSEAQAEEKKAKEESQAPPLKPAAAPDEVVARLRINNPAALADGVFDAFSIPIDWRKALGALESMKHFSKVVDFEGPVEGAVMLNSARPERPLHFISFGVSGVDPTLTALDAEGILLTEEPGGVVRFKLENEPCLVGRSLGPSPARVVCAETKAILRTVSDYALRGLPGETLSDAAIHAEADFRPIYARYGKELSRAQLLASVVARQAHVGHPTFDQALTDAAVGLAEEGVLLLDDLETVVAQVYESGGDFRASVKLRFEGDSSATVQHLLQMEKSQGPAPEIFQKLPQSAVIAGYARTLEETDTAKWMSILADLAQGAVESEGASAEFSSHVRKLVKALGPKGAVSVTARGGTETFSQNGKTALTSTWSLQGTTQAKSEVVSALDEVAWILASKELKTLLPRAKAFPQLTRVRATVPGAPGAVVYKWTLPKEWGEELAEVKTHKTRPDYVPDPNGVFARLSTGYIAVTEIDGDTWMAWTADGPPTSLSASFKALGAEGGKKMAESTEFASLRDEKAIAAGFIKLDALGVFAAWLMPEKLAKDWVALSGATPHHGRVPVTYTTHIKKGAVIEATTEWHIPKKFSQDVATLIALIAAEYGLD